MRLCALVFIFASLLPAAPAVAQTEESQTRIAFLSFAPSPYSNRHDCMRAGFGIYLLLKDLAQKEKLPLEVDYYDGAGFFEDADKIKKVLARSDVYVLGGSTWGQGPTWYVRRFFEMGGANNLMGVRATAWATAGGAHTGGEEVVGGILRSMMGMGASVFTLAQKYMVFTTDERLTPKTPGDFSQLDMWYMDQFARMIAVNALTNDRPAAVAMGKKLGVQPLYFLQTGGNEFPPSQATLDQYNPLLKRLNAAGNPKSPQWQGLLKLIRNP